MDDEGRLAVNRAVMRRNITELWGRGETRLVPELYAADVVDRMPVPGQRGGHDGLRDVLETFHAAFPDLEMELHGVLAEGDRAVDWWTFRGTHAGTVMGVPATGRRVEFSGIDVARIRAGRIVEIWHVEELARLYRQIIGP